MPQATARRAATGPTCRRHARSVAGRATAATLAQSCFPRGHRPTDQPSKTPALLSPYYFRIGRGMVNFIDLLNWAATIFVWGLGAVISLYALALIGRVLWSFVEAAVELLAWIFAGLPDYTTWQAGRKAAPRQ